MGQGLRSTAGVSLRALVVAFLVAGFGLWQGWSCTDGRMTSPMAAMTMTVGAAHGDGHQASSAHSASDRAPDPGLPAGMVGLCISVLASFAAALVLLSSPLKALGLVCRLGEPLLRPVVVVLRAPALTLLCVSRT